MATKINQHGGARLGAGRPPAKLGDASLNLKHQDPLWFLLAAMNDADANARLRIDGARAALPYLHAKKGESVKDRAQEASKKAGVGRFASSKPPTLAVVRPIA